MLRSTDKLSDLLTQIAYHRSQLDLHTVAKLEVQVKELQALHVSNAKTLVARIRAAATAAQELEALHVSNAKTLVARIRAAAAASLEGTVVPPPTLVVQQATPHKAKRSKRASHAQPGRINLQPGRINLQPGRIFKELTLEQKVSRAAAQRLRRCLSR